MCIFKKYIYTKCNRGVNVYSQFLTGSGIFVVTIVFHHASKKSPTGPTERTLNLSI